MHLPNTVLLLAAIALASCMESLQAHVYVGPSLRSVTTSRDRIEERGALKVPSCLGCLSDMLSPAKLLAAAAAKKAEANAAKLAKENAAKALTYEEETEQALQNLVYKLEKASGKMPETEPRVGFFIRSPRYDSFLHAVQEVNGKLPKGIYITPGRVLVRHFGYENVRDSIIKAMWSLDKQIVFRGNVLAIQYNTEVDNGRAAIAIVRPVTVGSTLGRMPGTRSF